MRAMAWVISAASRRLQKRTTMHLLSIGAADLYGDGDLDFLSATPSCWWFGPCACLGKVAWYANDGVGRFGPEQVITEEGSWE